MVQAALARLGFTALAAALLWGCGELSATFEQGKPCSLHESRACDCPGGNSGSQFCRADEEGFGDCVCDGNGTDGGADAGATLDASASDLARPDAGWASDAALGWDATFGWDVMQIRDVDQPRDAWVGYDSYSGQDHGIGSGVGASCNTSSCQDHLLCVGSIGAYYCRLPCTLGGGECNTVVEYCIELTGTNERACVPGGGPGASCSSQPCAELYICLAPNGSSDFRCQQRCDPNAANPGCPAGSTCYDVSGQPGGGCL